mgnify:CR=1 FL=1
MGAERHVEAEPLAEAAGAAQHLLAGIGVEADGAPDQFSVKRVYADAELQSIFRLAPVIDALQIEAPAVRLTHLPTGIVVSMQNEKSQIQNREAALRVLRSRLLERQRAEQDAEDSAARAAQVRTMDRSERIRTYNFPENRIADHRTGYKAHNLDAVLDGDLEAVIASCLALDEERRLAALGGDA